MLTEPRAAELLGALSSLIRTGRVVSQRSHGTSASGTQFGVLKLVSEQAIRLGDIATALMVAPSVASRAVSALETDGLVQRHPDPADARACLIGLTDLGRQRLRERHSFSLTQLREVLADWDDDEAALAVALFRRLEGGVGEFVSRLAGQPVVGRPDDPGGTDAALTPTSTAGLPQMEHQPA